MTAELEVIHLLNHSPSKKNLTNYWCFVLKKIVPLQIEIFIIEYKHKT